MNSMAFVIHWECHSSVDGGDTCNDVSAKHFFVTAFRSHNQNTAATTKTNVVNDERHPNHEMFQWKE